MYSVNKTIAIVVPCLALALVLIAPVFSHADEWNLTTRFEVNQPFEVPGMALQANTPYVIRLFDSPAERHVVQIYNADQTKMLTMFMAVSDERREPTDRTVFTFIETAPGYPLPMKEWFYPGRVNGLEFIYPKHQAVEISQHAREKVLSTSSTDLHDLASVKVEAVSPKNYEKTVVAATAANVTKLETPAIVEEKPTAASPAVVQESEVKQPEVQQPEVQQPEVQEPAVQQSTTTVQEDTTETTTPPEQQSNLQQHELPRTAGELPLMGLIGILCLGTGVGMRVLSANHK